MLIKKYFLYSSLGASFFLLGNIWDWPIRTSLRIYYQQTFGQHVYLCDNAMREHFIAKVDVTNEPSEIKVKELKSAELGLLKCHEYDKFRKYLLSIGLTEDDLSLMGLRAIELDNNNLAKVVSEHEIRY